MSGDNPHFYFHFMAKTLLEDEAGQSFADADAAFVGGVAGLALQVLPTGGRRAQLGRRSI
jgi:hypothetical protein